MPSLCSMILYCTILPLVDRKECTACTTGSALYLIWTSSVLLLYLMSRRWQQRDSCHRWSHQAHRYCVFGSWPNLFIQDLFFLFFSFFFFGSSSLRRTAPPDRAPPVCPLGRRQLFFVVFIVISPSSPSIPPPPLFLRHFLHSPFLPTMPATISSSSSLALTGMNRNS